MSWLNGNEAELERELGIYDVVIIGVGSALIFAVAMTGSRIFVNLMKMIWAVWSMLLDYLFAVYLALWSVVGVLAKIAIGLLIAAIVFYYYSTESQKAMAYDTAMKTAPVAHNMALRSFVYLNETLDLLREVIVLRRQ